jgi:hypothetical protein
MNFPKDSAFAQANEARFARLGELAKKKLPDEESDARIATTDPEALYHELDQIASLLDGGGGMPPGGSVSEARRRLLDLRDDLYRTLR